MGRTKYAALGLAVCAAFSAAPDRAGAQIGSTVTVIDQRPPGDDKRQVLSTSPLSCQYMVLAISDEARSFTRLEKLQQDIARLSGEQRPVESPLTVASYKIYLNTGAKSTKDAAFAALGAIGGALAKPANDGEHAMPKCSREKTKAAWFDPAATTNTNVPLVIEISGSYAGKPYAISSVYSPRMQISIPGSLTAGKFRKNLADAQTGPEVEAAMTKAHTALYEEITK